MSDSDESPDLTTRLMMKVNTLWMETREARQRSFSEQLGLMYQTLGQTENWKLGLLINSATVIIGVALYWVTSWPVNFVAFCIAILGLWGIVSWVLGL